MTSRLWTTLLSVILLIAAPSSRADDSADTLSLDEAIAQALEQAPQLAASTASIEGAEAGADAAGRLPDPELIAGVDNLPIETADRYSLTRDFMTMRKIGVMQSFPNAGKRRLRTVRAQREVDVARSQLQKSRFEVARDTASAWIALAVTNESLSRLRALQPELERQTNASTAALASGRSSAADALNAQTLAARFDERIAALEQDRAMQKAELSRWIGDGASRPLAAFPVDRRADSVPDALLEQVAMHAPLAQFSAEIDAARAEVDLARAEKRPDWSAEITYAKRGDAFADMVSLEFRVGLPLFAAHRQDAAISQGLATLRAMEATREAEIRMHRAEIVAAISLWNSGQPRLDRYAHELLPLARERTQAALGSYGAGRTDLRSATEALKDELEIELEYIALKGAVTGAWVFLHLLHDGGNAS
nr:A5 [uncultured bacterium]